MSDAGPIATESRREIVGGEEETAGSDDGVLSLFEVDKGSMVVATAVVDDCAGVLDDGMFSFFVSSATGVVSGFDFDVVDVVGSEKEDSSGDA